MFIFLLQHFLRVICIDSCASITLFAEISLNLRNKPKLQIQIEIVIRDCRGKLTGLESQIRDYILHKRKVFLLK